MRKNCPLPSASRRGFALVVVLAVVLMISVLIVGLLIMAENETKAAARYMDAADARLAADSVVEIVQGQIKEATLSGIGGDRKGTHAWASQPGAVRVFDDSGDLVNVFKLYSSDVMVSGTANFSGDVPPNWQDQPDAFVDLNAPVSRNNQWIYPIASPEALPTNSSGAPNTNPVVGFDTTRPKGSAAWDDRLAMPVRWIYVQEDGSLNTDPAVGDPVLRVAYWTDDESSKININTASATDANSYADIPRANFLNERNLIARMQPSQNEFNRYPGHPATVNLGTVFPAADIQSLIEASPRFEWGGSQNATIPVTSGATISNRAALTAAKRNRLYVSPDEFLYTPDRSSQLLLSADLLDQRRFFLTTTSRGSDLNLFGQPRVTIWPLSALTDNNHRTPYDQLIASCSTIGGGSFAHQYYFERIDPLSQENDWNGPQLSKDPGDPSKTRNEVLFSVLQDLTGREIPGFGGNFREKYDETSGGVSGERDQILTEIFDYIRCSNLNETFSASGFNANAFETFTTKVTTYLNEPNQRNFRGAGFVLPIKISDYGTRGAGRVPVISEVGLWFIQTRTETGVDPGGNPIFEDPDPAEVQTGLLVETFSPMQGFMPWVPHNFSYRVSSNITAPMILHADGVNRPLFPDAETTTTNHGPGGVVSSGHSVGGIDGWGWMWAGGFQNGAATGLNLGAAVSPMRNPFFVRKPDAIPVSGQIQITGGEIEIEFLCDPVWAREGVLSSGEVFQKYTISIPSGTFPIPAPADPNISPAAAAAKDAGRDGWYSRKNSSGNNHPWFYPEDVVHGIPSRDGDFRIAAYLEVVPAGFFEKEPDFGTLVQFSHGFRGGSNYAFRGTRSGGYVPVPYGGETESDIWDSLRPKIRSSITSLTDEGWEGDFDTGIANLADGPYLNKSDEGMMSSNVNNDPYYFKQWYRGSGLFSPLKQMPSPVVFGSLPTGVKRTEAAYSGGNPSNAQPWRTLNFCRYPLSGDSHFGRTDPPDYLLLDLFRMPVVEPYAITESFSTAGQLNMNYQIVPFNYIERKTAMHAALASQQVIALNNTYASDYKSSTQGSGGVPTRTTRYPLNVPEVLSQFDQRFLSNDIFRSPSEICDIFLIPQGRTLANVQSWWDDHQLTGNNLRERPYATLYPLLTTKSNVFTTHLRAQAIKRSADGRINVNGEYRGSVTFERFLDPNDPRFTDGTVDPDAVSLEPYFRFRTLMAKQFDL